MALRHHECVFSTLLEAKLFQLVAPTNAEGDCPICLEPLARDARGVCCGGYARPLKACGHVIHVSCHVDRNPDLLRCPLCRAQLGQSGILAMTIDHKIKRVCNATTVQQRALLFDCLEGKIEPNDEIFTLLGFNPNALRRIIEDFLAHAQDADPAVLTDIYARLLRL